MAFHTSDKAWLPCEKKQCEKKNRFGKCPLMSEKELNKSGRGSFDYHTDVN